MNAPDLFLTPASRSSASYEALRNRLPYLVDETGEDFRAGRGSLPLELLRAGFIEWAGMKARSDAFARDGLAALDDTYSYMPLVLCRDRAHVQRALACDMQAALLVVGTPASTSGALVPWPIDVQGNIERAATAWLGAPSHVADGQDVWRLPVACDMRSLSVDTVKARLRSVEALWLRCGVTQGFVLLNLDGMRSLTERRDAVDDEVFAAALTWAQRGVHEATVIIYGEGTACAKGQQAMGHVARHLGRALFRPARRW